MRIGVISDTHDYIDPRLFDIFSGVGRIMHAGDIVKMDVILELSAIAPVIAVRGNMDPPDIAGRYPMDQRVQIAGTDIFMTHNGGMLLRNPKAFNERCGPKRPDVFIWGHTHRAEIRIIEGMLSLNPGSPSRPMFGLPSSVAILTVNPNDAPSAEIVILET